jgi:hypothetical protein
MFWRIKMKIKTIISLLFLTFLVFGCTSVPKVSRENTVESNKYDVVIDRDYINKPAEFKYAVNTFVIQHGGTSYDIEKHGPNDFYITIPGETPVEDLPDVKHFHVGRTLGLILPTTLVPAFILLLIFL